MLPLTVVASFDTRAMAPLLAIVQLQADGEETRVPPTELG
jgi:hypothetical protein